MPTRPPVFRPPHQPTKAETDRARGSARARGYTKAWDRAAALFKREYPLCLGCQAVGRYAATEVVDHVEPHRGDMAKFWDRSMWQPACRWHHDVVKQKLETLWWAGSIDTPELWLNSDAAIRLTKYTPQQPRMIGVDGWPR